MDDFTPPPEQQFYGHVPHRPSTVLNIWNALWPPALYAVMQLVVSIVGSVLLSIRLSLNQGYSMVDRDELEALLTDAFSEWIMPFMVISMVLCLAVFIPFYIRFHRGEEKRSGLTDTSFGKALLNIFLLLLLTVTAYFFINMAISLLPADFGNYSEHMESLATGSFFWQFLVVGIGAPIVEELCLRGLTLNRLLKTMPPAPAIIIQALIFGVIHLNIVQGTYAFLLGLILGWLCWRSRSLWPPILLHFFMNAGNVLLSLIQTGDDVPEEVAGNPYITAVLAIIMVCSLACSAALIYALNKTLPGRKLKSPEAPVWQM